MPDVQTDEEPPDRAVLRPLDLLEHVRDRSVLEAGELRELLRIQRVDVGGVLDQSLLEQTHHRHVSEVLDVHGSAPREMEEPFEPLGRTSALVRTAVVGLALAADERGSAGVAGCRHLPAPGALLPTGRHRPDDLGDHVARPSHDHRVPRSDVLAPDLVLVVQRRVRDRHAADEHGLEHGERCDLPRPPGVDIDRAQQRGPFLRRELVRDRPAGRV